VRAGRDDEDLNIDGSGEFEGGELVPGLPG